MTQAFHETMIEMAKILKGAPLYQAEEEAVVEAFEKREGPSFDRAMEAIAELLHSTPELTRERAEVLNREDGLMTALWSAAQRRDAERKGG